MKWVMNAYHGNTEWIKGYTSDVVFYDKKDKNVGSNIFDYMSYIVDNYDNLSDVTLFGKTNMLERHITKEEFDKVVNNKTFTPLLTKNHKIDGVINYYEDGLYYEVNSSWYFHHYDKHYSNYGEVAKELGLPNPKYLGFAPGACYIVPKASIHKHSKEYYSKIKNMVSRSENPAEAHAIERSLYNLWH